MPVLQFLIRRKIFNKIFCTSNRIIRDGRFLKIANVKESIFFVDPMWRRFNKDNWDEIYRFLKLNKITEIYNFRNENLEEYIEFKDKYSEFNYHNLDFEKLKSRKEKITVYDDIFSFFEDIGYVNNKTSSEWLFHFRDRQKNSDIKVGFMVSAGQMNKKLHTKKWVDLGKMLLNNINNLTIEIFSGIKEDEVKNSEYIVNQIGSLRSYYVGSLDLMETLKRVGDLNCLVSNDTGLIHMAGAIGIPTIGIYISTDPEIWKPNIFVKNDFVKSDTVGKCENWKFYAGTCDHFYQICKETRKENIDPKVIYNKVQEIIKYS